MKGIMIAVPLVAAFIVLLVVITIATSTTASLRDTVGYQSCAARTDGFTRYNTSSLMCNNATGHNLTVGTADWNATIQGLTGMRYFSEQNNTIATIIVAIVLLGLIVGVFAFVRLRR